MPHKGDKKMKLEKFTKNKRIKKIMIGSIVGIVLIIGGITLYRTFAFYEEKKEFNVLQGRVPDFKEGDIQLSVFVNEERVEAIPERGNYLVDVSCDKGAIGSWDYNKWSVSVSNFVTKTKCDVKFTSVSESEMPSNNSFKRVTRNVSVTPLSVPGNDEGMNSTRTVIFDFSDIEGYENFTVDNFIANINAYTAMIENNMGAYAQVRSSIITISYNQTTGVVTVEYCYVFRDVVTFYKAESSIECTLFYN